MKKRLFALALLVLFLAVSYSYNSSSQGLNCTIINASNCNAAALLYLKNNSNGYFNAHAQLPSNGSYPYSVCCDAVERNDTINTSCIDATFLRLNKTTDSHVETGNRNKYANRACINAVNGIVSCSYFNDSCPANYTCLTSIASSEPTDYNETNAHAGNCSQYKTKICCSLNSPPDVPALVSPANDSSITNRTPNFLWNATDPENDTMTFDLFIFCSGGCSIDNREYTGLNYTNFTIPTELKYFGDDNYYYTWYVRAYDGVSYSQNSTTFKFTLNSLVSLTLVNATINFTSMSIGQINNTTDDSPNPFVLRNDGNSFADVNISATEMLWDSQPGASKYFQYKADNFTAENYSFNWSGSTTGWTYVPLANQTFLSILNYSDATDTAEIDILAEVPLDESSGGKSATVIFTGRYVRVDI